MPVTDSYENDGYVSPIAVMTPEEAAGHVEALRVQEAKFGGQLSTATNAKAHLLFPFLWDIVQDPRIVDHVERILGPTSCAGAPASLPRNRGLLRSCPGTRMAPAGAWTRPGR